MTTCVLDGEIVALGEDGRPSFSRLQHRMHVANQREARRRATIGPGQLRGVRPAVHRRALAAGAAVRRAAGPARVAASLGRDLHDHGVVPGRVRPGHPRPRPCRTASRVSSPSDATRPTGPVGGIPDWIKVKSFRTQEVVIGGWTEGRGEREGSLGALLLGIPDAGRAALRRQGRDRLQRHAPPSPPRRPAAAGDAGQPLRSPLPAGEAASAHFVRPELVGEVAFGEWTTAGRLRHPTWRGLRPDKAPDEVVVE